MAGGLGFFFEFGAEEGGGGAGGAEEAGRGHRENAVPRRRALVPWGGPWGAGGGSAGALGCRQRWRRVGPWAPAAPAASLHVERA